MFHLALTNIFITMDFQVTLPARLVKLKVLLWVLLHIYIFLTLESNFLNFKNKHKDYDYYSNLEVMEIIVKFS